jgi:hypothetical protein
VLRITHLVIPIPTAARIPSHVQKPNIFNRKMKDPYFHIAWIIELIQEQEPDRLNLIEQLEKVERKKWVRQPYVQFVSSYRANQPGAEYQFEESIVLEHETEGTIVLDILKDGRIGGIEFVSQIP